MDVIDGYVIGRNQPVFIFRKAVDEVPRIICIHGLKKPICCRLRFILIISFNMEAIKHSLRYTRRSSHTCQPLGVILAFQLLQGSVMPIEHTHFPRPFPAKKAMRPEERRVGKECESTCK